jgi:Flp pilus assembly protein TadG
VRALGKPISASKFKSALSALHGTEASQLLEFAVALPLLVVFVVGIFDFGDAFNLKQKLNNAAREGARFASTLPANDLSQVGACNAPTSVCAIRDLVDSYLLAGRINDCGLTTPSATTTWSAATMTATYSASGNGCPGTLTLKVEREYSFPETVTGATTTINVVSTRVSLSYPYRWHFNRVIQFVAPGASYAGVTQISTDAIVSNMD